MGKKLLQHYASLKIYEFLGTKKLAFLNSSKPIIILLSIKTFLLHFNLI